jgi:hypothetical protein
VQNQRSSAVKNLCGLCSAVKNESMSVVAVPIWKSALQSVPHSSALFRPVGLDYGTA